MRRKVANSIPEFKSLEEEQEYWEERGPLAEGHKGRINKPKSGQKRSSFLVVRLTGDELTRLRDVAGDQGLGPSTFARLVLLQTMESHTTPPELVTSGGPKVALLRESLPLSARYSTVNTSQDISVKERALLSKIHELSREELEQSVSLVARAFLAAGIASITFATDAKKTTKASVCREK